MKIKAEIRSWGRENPELVVVLFLVLLGFFVVIKEGDPTAIITGVFGYLTGVAGNPVSEAGGDTCEWLSENGYCTKPK